MEMSRILSGTITSPVLDFINPSWDKKDYMLQIGAEFGFRFTTCLHKWIKQRLFLLPDTLTDHFMLPWENSNKTDALFYIGTALFNPSQSGQSPGLMLPYRQLLSPCSPCRACQGSLVSWCLQELGSSQFLLPPPEAGVDGLPITWTQVAFDE